MCQMVMFVDDCPELVALRHACYENMDKLKDELVIQHYISNYRMRHKNMLVGF